MKNSHRFFENKECQYYPCHPGLERFNCLFCYCPLYTLEKCGGTPSYIESEDRRIKVCTDCTFPHKPENYEKLLQILKNGVSQNN